MTPKPVPAPTAPVPVSGPRVNSVDIVRGLVIVLMAIDHTREFFHADAMVGTPEDLTRSSAALFLTRWITHICAPAFMLLAGISAFLWQRGKDRTTAELSTHLLQRGLLLIVLDLVVMRFAMFFSLTSAPVLLSVLWALGWAMVALAGLAHAPVRILWPLSAAVILLHNLADRVQAASFASLAPVWNILHQPGVFFVKGIAVFVAYPLIPWIAVMAIGYCLGPAIGKAESRRNLIVAGVLISLAFVVLRTFNVYGDPRPWQAAIPLSFLNTTKYPPSLQFLLMTLGPTLILLGATAGAKLSHLHPLRVFGRVPLFFFVGHFFLIHALTFPFAWLRYGRVEFLWLPAPSMGGRLESYPPSYGYDLAAVYGIWLLVLALMYPACLYVARRRHSVVPVSAKP